MRSLENCIDNETAHSLYLYCKLRLPAVDTVFLSLTNKILLRPWTRGLRNCERRDILYIRIKVIRVVTC